MIHFITQVNSEQAGKVFTQYLIILTCEKVKPRLFKEIAQPMLKAIVKNQLIHPEHFWTCQQEEAGGEHVDGHLSLTLPARQEQAMVTLVAFPIHVAARAWLLVSLTEWVSMSYAHCMSVTRSSDLPKGTNKGKEDVFFYFNDLWA